jgi:NifU-like protein involved in Fe-S cluster formation
VPITRILFTYDDVVSMISDKYKVPKENISVYHNGTLSLSDFMECQIEVEHNSFIFQAEFNQ